MCKRVLDIDNLDHLECGADIHDEIVSEPETKRRRITSNSTTTPISSIPHTETLTITDDNVPIVNQSISLFPDNDDNKQFLSIYQTLSSMNIFNLNVPIDILRIIAHNAVGIIIPCPLCKDTETLVMYKDIKSPINPINTCDCDKCESSKNLLVCCLNTPKNQKKCEFCDKIYCITCCNKYNCMNPCTGCGYEFCYTIDCGVQCPVTKQFYCEACLEYLCQCDHCGEYADSITQMECACCHFQSNCECSACEYKWHRWDECEDCGEYICADCMISCINCDDKRFCAKCLKKETRECAECGDICCDKCISETKCISIRCWDVHCKTCVYKCQRSSVCDNYYCKDCKNICPYCEGWYCDECIEPEGHECKEFVDISESDDFYYKI